MTVPFKQFFAEAIEGNGFTVLPIEIHHSAILSLLPMHHKDPFDRMIIAQAISEAIPVISSDVQFDAYNVKRIWRGDSSSLV